MKKLPSFSLFCLLAGLVVSRAADWPRFLGPDANSISTETNLLAAFPPGGPKVLWDNEVGTGYSAPSVRAGRVVLHHRVRGKEVETVEAFEAATGKLLWQYAYPSGFVDPFGYNNGPRCTPLLTETHCYTFGAEGRLVCLDVKTGSLVWARETAKEWTIPEAFFGVGSTPLLEGGSLIVMVGGQPNSGVVALDPLTGKTKWESVGKKNWEGVPMTGWPGERAVAWQDWEKQASYASPVAATVHGQRVVFCLMRQGLVALNPADGKVHFSFWFRARVNESVNAVNPLVVGNQVLITAAYYKVGSVLLDIAPDLGSVKEVWRSTALESHWSPPILKEGNVYAFSGRNEPDALFRCVEYKSGKVLWERDERWQGHARTAPTYGRGSAILAEDRLIVLGEGGLLGLFKATPDKAVELARWQVPSLHHPCWAAPVLSDRRLFLRSEDHLVCLDFAK